jgi:hypothetical protein
MRCGIDAFHLLDVTCESLNLETEQRNREGLGTVEAFCSAFDANCVRVEGVTTRSRTAKTHYTGINPLRISGKSTYLGEAKGNKCSF